MGNLKKLFAVILLALALGAPVYAGDMSAPPSPPPPPPEEHSQAVPAPDPNDSPAPDDIIDPTTVAFDLLYDFLSMY